MVKLYFKKLVSILLYGASVFGVFYVGYSILAIISNFFTDYPIVRYAILFGVPLGIVLKIVCTYRVENAVLRREFLSFCEDQSISFQQKCRFIMCFSHFRAEMLAYATYAFLFSLVFGIANGASAPWYANLFAGTVFFLLIMLAVGLVDLLSWLLICRKWLRES